MKRGCRFSFVRSECSCVKINPCKMTVRAMRMTVVSAALFALVFVHLRLDGVHERQHVLDDRLLLGGQRTVHLVDADARVGVDLVRNTLAGTDVLGGREATER